MYRLYRLSTDDVLLMLSIRSRHF